jgi:hypothetical protein
MNQLAESLGPMARSFERHVLWAVKAILEAEVAVHEPFQVTDAPPSGSALFCLIPNSNLQYLAQLAVGVSKEDLPELFPAETEARLRLDALGEMSNVVSGLLMADEDFLERFGHLKPSTPFFSEGAFTDRMDTGIRGSVTVGGRLLAFHLTIRKAGRETWHGEPVEAKE